MIPPGDMPAEITCPRFWTMSQWLPARPDGPSPRMPSCGQQFRRISSAFPIHSRSGDEFVAPLTLSKGIPVACFRNFPTVRRLCAPWKFDGASDISFGTFFQPRPQARHRQVADAAAQQQWRCILSRFAFRFASVREHSKNVSKPTPSMCHLSAAAAYSGPRGIRLREQSAGTERTQRSVQYLARQR